MTDKIPDPPDESPRWAVPFRAIQEERKWPDEEALEGQKGTNKLWALRAIGVATFFLILSFVVAFIATFLAWAWHQIGPQECLWLTESQLSKIQSVIFSGAIAAVATSYAQKHI